MDDVKAAYKLGVIHGLRRASCVVSEQASWNFWIADNGKQMTMQDAGKKLVEIADGLEQLYVRDMAPADGRED